MAAPSQFKAADFGGEPEDVCNAAGNRLYKEVVLNWCTPRPWNEFKVSPVNGEDTACLYALVRNHHKSQSKDHIAYIGLTTNPQDRFLNHPKAQSIVERQGSVGLSLAPINITSGRNRVHRIKTALEEIEHLLIWAVWHELENDKKMFTLPGMGTNGGNAWHITNEGYRFSGRMPREILYPWMLVKPGRDRTSKVTERVLEDADAE